MRSTIALLVALAACGNDDVAKDLGLKDRVASVEASRLDWASCPLSKCSVTSGVACCNNGCCSIWGNVQLRACNVATGSCLTFCSDCLVDGYRACMTAGASDGRAALIALCSKDAQPGQ